MQKTEMKESNVPDLIHKLRKAKKWK
jgi:hypothetical protein